MGLNLNPAIWEAIAGTGWRSITVSRRRSRKGGVELRWCREELAVAAAVRSAWRRRWKRCSPASRRTLRRPAT